MNTSPPPESSSRSAAAPTRTTPGTIVIGSTCWAVMTPMIADPQTPRPSCVYYCTLRTPTPAIHHTKVHVKALDARLGALPCQESWGYLARYRGETRRHAESDLRAFLTWCRERGLDPLAARRPHVELYVRWMQETRRYAVSTVSRRMSIVGGFYRTCVIDEILEPVSYTHLRAHET